MRAFLIGALATGAVVATFAGCSSGSDDPTPQIDQRIPCDVAQVLATSCWRCHGKKLDEGAPFPLLTRGDLLAEDTTGKRRVDSSVSRMRDTQFPMPPAPAALVPDAGVQAFQAWIAAGTPAGTCTADDVTGAGGAAGGAGAAGTAGGGGSAPVCPEDPFACGDQCTSGKTWVEMPGTGQDYKEMQPGRGCVGCHAVAAKPELALWIGGTVYPTAHEPDFCEGSPGDGAVVEVTDDKGATFMLPVNKVGNFYLLKADAPGFAAPYKAKVVVGNKQRAMKDAQKGGDCNLCHTQAGDNNDPGMTKKAPGRIVLP